MIRMQGVRLRTGGDGMQIQFDGLVSAAGAQEAAMTRLAEKQRMLEMLSKRIADAQRARVSEGRFAVEAARGAAAS